MRQQPSITQTANQILRGERYTLTPMKPEHISQRYIDWLNDPEVNRFLDIRFQLPQTRQTAQEYVSSFYAETERYLWLISPNNSSGFIGTVSLPRVIRRNGWAGVGLMIGEKDYWGQGAAAESISLVAAFAFDALGLRRLYAEAVSHNLGINFTFKRLGFTLEGKLRESQIIEPGVYADTYCWGLLATDWREQCQNDS